MHQFIFHALHKTLSLSAGQAAPAESAPAPASAFAPAMPAYRNQGAMPLGVAQPAGAYATLAARMQTDPRPLILDSFCGTGQSTALLAQRHPDCLVAGVDQSAHRLGKHVAEDAGNYLLLRAQAEDIWQLLLRDGYRLAHHYLLYPNPWPKNKHLQRRIHGHPGFAWLIALGGAVELRSNWQLYVEEFGFAMHLAGGRGCVARVLEEPPMTLFEEKYRRSGHALWRYTQTPP